MKGVGSRLKQACCLLVAFGILLQTYALAADEPPIEQPPQVEIQLVQIEKGGAPDGTLEVGVNVTAQQFRSVATVLQYDNTKLELLDWSTSAEPVPIEDGHNSWANAYGLVAAKSADTIGSRPVLAYRAGNITYLFLAAECFRPTATEGRLVTVRFRCVEDEDGNKMEALVSDSGAFGREGRVLRFATPGRAASMVSAAVQCTVGENDLLFADSYFQLGGENNPDTITVTWSGPARGKSVLGDTQSHAVTFLDWDGSVLETLTLAPEEDVSGLLQTIQKENSAVKAALEGKVGYQFDCWLDWNQCKGMITPPHTSNNEPLDRAKYQAVIADGKDFSRHLSLGDGTGTILQAAYMAKKSSKTANRFDVSFRPREDTSKSSAYSFDMENIVYDRYGAATAEDGKYSVTVPVSRIREESMTQYGCERAVSPGARVMMKPKEGLYGIYSYQMVVNSDSITFEMVPTRDMEYIEFELVDAPAGVNWPAAGSRSGSTERLEMDHIIEQGTAHYIVRQARLKLAGDPRSEWDDFVDEQAFKDITKGNGVLDVELAKQLILEALKKEEPPVEKRVDAAGQEEFKLAAEPRYQSDLDFLWDILLSMGGLLKCTIQSYDPKNPVTFTTWKWDENKGEYTDETAYQNVGGIELWSPEAEAEANRPGKEGEEPEYPWVGNGLGTGLYRQTFRLKLPQGKYKLVIEKPSHAPIVIEGFEIAAYISVGESLDVTSLYAAAIQNPGFVAFYLPCGDVNGDRAIRIDDLYALQNPANYGKPAPPGSDLARYDLNGDGYINMEDVAILTSPSNLGKGEVVFVLGESAP